MLKLGADSAVSLTSKKRSPEWSGARTTTSGWSQHCWSWLPGERLKACSAARRDCKCSSDLFCCPCSSVKAHTHHCGIWLAHCSAASNSDACCCPGSRVSYTYALRSRLSDLGVTSHEVCCTVLQAGMLSMQQKHCRRWRMLSRCGLPRSRAAMS